jgi:hypothetical protein
MAQEPLPTGWEKKDVLIELTRGGHGVRARLTSSSGAGCIVEREMPEADAPEPVTRRVFYPWTTVLSVTLLEEPTPSSTKLVR